MQLGKAEGWNRQLCQVVAITKQPPITVSKVYLLYSPRLLCPTHICTDLFSYQPQSLATSLPPHILDHLLTSHNRTSPLITNPNSFASFALSSSTQCTSAHCSLLWRLARISHFDAYSVLQPSFYKRFVLNFFEGPFSIRFHHASCKSSAEMIFGVYHSVQHTFSGWVLPYLILSWNVRNYATWCFLHFPEIHSIRPVAGQHPGSDNLAHF